MQAPPAILIVDDSPANLRLYLAILRDLGADLFTAGSGEQALARCAERPYAMILLDVHLSGMNGFQVAHALRESAQGTEAPIVFVSAVYTHERDVYQAYELGAVDYILSPVVPDILRAKAAVFIRLHRMRREAEAQSLAVEKAYRELRSAHAELEGFSYSVSHDLRTPLGQIAGFAELLEIGHAQQLDTKGRDYLGHIGAAAKRMAGLMDDLLLLARMARSEMQGEEVDLSLMARQIAGELAQAEPRRDVQWTTDGQLHAQCDPRLMRVALANLLGNAWKYSAGAAPARIEFGRIETDGKAVFYVRDNGAGFDARRAAGRLFRPFQRFHSEAAFPGTGVGLAIVHRVVMKHGGIIWAESVPGEGASFFFTLPPLAEGAQATEQYV